MLRACRQYPPTVAISKHLNVEEGEIEGLPCYLVRFHNNLLLSEKVAARAGPLIGP